MKEGRTGVEQHCEWFLDVQASKDKTERQMRGMEVKKEQDVTLMNPRNL